MNMGNDAYHKLTVLTDPSLDDLKISGLTPLAKLITDISRDKVMNRHTPQSQKDLAIAEMILADLMENATSRITKTSLRHRARAEEVAWALGVLEGEAVGEKEDIKAIRETLPLAAIEPRLGDMARKNYLEKCNTAFIGSSVAAG
jgi:hypothetical protein